MEQHELVLIETYQGKDPELKALWDQHLEYERMLDKFEGRTYLSPTQIEEVKQLKKKKLAGKTKLSLLLEKYRQSEA